MFKKMVSAKQLREGEMIPRFYGIVEYDYALRVVVAYPIPINLCVRAARKIWKHVIFTQLASENTMEAYCQGVAVGRKHAMRTRDEAVYEGKVVGFNAALNWMADSLEVPTEEIESQLPDWHPRRKD